MLRRACLEHRPQVTSRAPADGNRQALVLVRQHPVAPCTDAGGAQVLCKELSRWLGDPMWRDWHATLGRLQYDPAAVSAFLEQHAAWQAAKPPKDAQQAACRDKAWQEPHAAAV